MESCCHGDHGWQRKQNEERERERMGNKPEEEGGSEGLETTRGRKGERRCQEGRWE